MEGEDDIHISVVENVIHFGDSASPAVDVPAPPTVMEGLAGETPVSIEGKKKRGRPKKYGADGNLALSPMPISTSIPLTGGGDYSSWNKGKVVGSYKKKQKLEFMSPGDRMAYSAGANFTPHIITVNAGEDVSMKIMSFSRQGSRAICILAANGAISNVTLRQSNSSGGTLTYEGRFEILSLSGSFMPTDNGGTKSIAGGMSVSLAGPDGHVLGGGLAGLLIAAGPVQVMIGSFVTGNQQEPKPKKQRPEFSPTFSPVPATNYNYAGGNDAVYPGPLRSITPASYPRNHASSSIYVNGQTTVAAENHTSLPGGQTDLAAENKFLSGEGHTVVAAAENNISLAGEGQTVVAAENNISLAGEGQTVVAAENNISLAGEGQTVVAAAENNIFLPGEDQNVVACENNVSLPGESQTIVAAENKISTPTKSEKLSPSKCVISC